MIGLGDTNGHIYFDIANIVEGFHKIDSNKV